MKQIRIERQKGYYGVLRALDVFVDGARLGKLKQGETKVFEVQEISGEIWGKMDWGKTHNLSLHEYDPGKAIVFKAYFTLNPFKIFGISKLPFKVFVQ
ncbi:MAG: hypothetical protein P5684_25835 [Limnospira sp. PMC 1238.20]|uniref:hypothetical protein n=1 Tax=Limnospira sp. PMC 1238.20 TaxID=2981036 RepID=UPI0028E11A26|nr:hypothetical protein [Limnospira sp. PMC 1238.20]MDT9180981.1 hypothetical protein [Limnospira sp. PMC 1238.20]